MFDLDDEEGNDIDTSEKIINDNDKGSNNNMLSNENEQLKRRINEINTNYISEKKAYNDALRRNKYDIQKMDDNMEAAAREFQSTYYQDVTIDEWSVSKTDKHSDKKAAKLLDKELT